MNTLTISRASIFDALCAAAAAAAAGARYAARRWQRDLLLRLMAEA